MEKKSIENKKRRLIALVPESDLDEIQFARRVRGFASRNNLEVIFLTMVRDIDEELGAKRRMITLGAITRDALTPVKTEIYFGKNWVKAIKSIWQAGDLILCHTEQTIVTKFLNLEPLSAHLVNVFEAPVLTVSGFFQERKQHITKRLPRILSWAILLAIFIVFFGIEINIDKSTHGWAHTALGLTAVIVEIFLIWIWSTVTG